MCLCSFADHVHQQLETADALKWHRPMGSHFHRFYDILEKKNTARNLW